METGLTTNVLAGQNAPRNPNGHRTADQPDTLVMASDGNCESVAAFTVADCGGQAVVRRQPNPGPQNALMGGRG